MLVVHIKGVGEVFGLAARRAPKKLSETLTHNTPGAVRRQDDRGAESFPFKSTPRVQINAGGRTLRSPSDDTRTTFILGWTAEHVATTRHNALRAGQDVGGEKKRKHLENCQNKKACI